MRDLLVFALIGIVITITNAFPKKNKINGEKTVFNDLLKAIKQLKEKRMHHNRAMDGDNAEETEGNGGDGGDEVTEELDDNEESEASDNETDEEVTGTSDVADESEGSGDNVDECIPFDALDSEFDPDDMHVNAFLDGQVTDLLAVCGERSSKRTSKGKRIVGGKPAGRNDNPWQTSLVNQGASVCGGALVTKEWVLTAAHCFISVNEKNETTLDNIRLCDWHIIAGEYNLYNPFLKLRPVKDIKIHPNFSMATMDHDIALMLLEEPVELDDETNVICLPSLHFKESYVPEKGLDDCYVAGWGNMISQSIFGEEIKFPEKLHSVSTPLLSAEDENKCKERYKAFGAQVPETSFCAGYFTGSKDTCQGDSGGPLVCEEFGFYYQVGVVSYGLGCAWTGFPGIYTNVSAHATWVISVLQRFTPGGVKELGWEDIWDKAFDELLKLLSKLFTRVLNQ